MTFSILAIDPESGAIGGAAATGSLCVGGWVLRGRLDSGMSASQGASPSTFWGEDVLDAMRVGQSATDAVTAVTRQDRGKDYRQLSALSLSGATGVFTGDKNTAISGSRHTGGVVVAGNLLASADVLDATLETVQLPTRSFAE